MTHKNTNPKNRTLGFTLIEVLVVVSLLVIITAMVIPQVRVVNKDRNIREAARVVGSAFSSASQRATIDGIAGIEIVRNSNFSDAVSTNAFDPFYAGTQIYTLRALPPYTGDGQGSAAVIVPFDSNANGMFDGGDEIRVYMRTPLEYIAADDERVIFAGDTIQFNYREISYDVDQSPVASAEAGNVHDPEFDNDQIWFPISNQQLYPFPPFSAVFGVLPWDSGTTYNDDNVDPAIAPTRCIHQGAIYRSMTAGNSGNIPSTSPADWQRVGAAEMAFNVRRQPVRKDSSLVVMPAGYYIDLRFSHAGFFAGGANAGQGIFCPPYWVAADGQAGPGVQNIRIMFDQTGGIETIDGVTGFDVATTTVFNASYTPTKDLSLFIVEDSLDGTPEQVVRQMLNQPEYLWVNVRRSNGGTSISYNTPPEGNGLVIADNAAAVATTRASRIYSAGSISRTGAEASQ